MIKIIHKNNNPVTESFIYYGKDTVELEILFDGLYDSDAAEIIQNFMKNLKLEQCKKIIFTDSWVRECIAAIHSLVRFSR